MKNRRSYNVLRAIESTESEWSWYSQDSLVATECREFPSNLPTYAFAPSLLPTIIPNPMTCAPLQCKDKETNPALSIWTLIPPALLGTLALKHSALGAKDRMARSGQTNHAFRRMALLRSFEDTGKTLWPDNFTVRSWLKTDIAYQKLAANLETKNDVWRYIVICVVKQLINYFDIDRSIRRKYESRESSV